MIIVSQKGTNDKSNSISVSTVESLNNYRNSVKLANYKTCIKCKANCTEYGATEVNPEIVNVDVNSEMLYIRRLGKFCLCSYCSTDDEKESVRSGPSLTITSCTFEDRTMTKMEVQVKTFLCQIKMFLTHSVLSYFQLLVMV